MTCSKCGKCCQGVQFIIPKNPLLEVDKDYYIYHHIKVTEDEKNYYFDVQNKCEYLLSGENKYIFENSACELHTDCIGSQVTVAGLENGFLSEWSSYKFTIKDDVISTKMMKRNYQKAIDAKNRS